MTAILVIWICFLINSSWSLDDSSSAKILQSNYQNTGTGPYHFSFETSNGIYREEEGTLVNPNNAKEASIIVRGSYSYADQTGKVYTVQYTADKNGFHPVGDHIKVPPFVPWNHHHHHHHHHDDGHDEIHDSTVEQHPNQLYLPSSTVLPENRYLPTTPSPKSLDGSNLQNTIINLLTNRDGHRITVEDVNSL